MLSTGTYLLRFYTHYFFSFYVPLNELGRDSAFGHLDFPSEQDLPSTYKDYNKQGVQK